MKERRLHIGALRPSPGWESLNSQHLKGIDHVCDARDLSRFADGTFAAVYSSHVLEHFDYRNEVSSVLKEWYRVLAVGGKLYVSVPDLDTICRLYCDRERFNAKDRFMLMRMIMGGHCDRYDYHQVAFDQETLVRYLVEAGFGSIKRCRDFGFFNDTSNLRFKGELISLNVIVEKKSLVKADSIATKNAADAVQRFIDISVEKINKLHEAGYTTEAIAQYTNMLSLYPDNDHLIIGLARLNQIADRAEEALPLLKRISADSQFYAEALYLVGMILGDRGDFTGAVESLTRASEIGDRQVECYNQLARFLIGLGRAEEARTYLLRSIEVAPDCAETYNYLGNLYKLYWRLAEASEQYRRVIQLQPGYASAYRNLAWIATLEGDIDTAVAVFHTALELQPDNRIGVSNLLFTLNYSDRYTPEQVRDEHFRLAAVFGASGPMHIIGKRRPGQNKTRIGYVSGDFKIHSVAFFLEPVLRNHNKDDFEIFCYDMVPVPDETTRRMMGLGWIWRTVYGLSDRRLVDQIQTDGIDILVDLSGHTEGNRLGVFALRPAPVQVTWLGYPNTTGLTQIDFRLSDAWADPPGMTDHLYAESLVRLPRSFICYSPPSMTPPTDPLPEGPIIFCCFNNYPKISDVTIQLWARVLHAVPGSLLSLKNSSLGNRHVRDRLVKRFAACGIDRSRLIVAARLTLEAHLQLYGACHIALDTYPYHGTTTTCEALWMGVPVITLAGPSHAARVGVSILTNAGLLELIATTADQYVEIAAVLAKDRQRLQDYRRLLRNQLAGSTLMDATRFTADLEQAYRGMMERLTAD